MAIKSDKWIIEQCLGSEPMITPFEPELITSTGISYGVSSYGYDLRVDNKYKIFHNLNNSLVDPKNFTPDNFKDHEGDFCIIPPNSFALAVTKEYLRIPKDVLALFIGKSTYARCGIILNVTPAEPGWEGYLTLEISNTTPLPCKIYSNEGICQALFFQSDEKCLVDYSARKGKYQNQIGITLPRK